MRKRGELATDNLIKRCEPRVERERQVSRWLTGFQKAKRDNYVLYPTVGYKNLRRRIIPHTSGRAESFQIIHPLDSIRLFHPYSTHACTPSWSSRLYVRVAPARFGYRNPSQAGAWQSYDVTCGNFRFSKSSLSGLPFS